MDSLNRIFQIARQTWNGFLRDRIFYAVIVIAFLMLGFSYFLASLTIIESRKILLDFGFAAVSFAGVLIAIFCGVTSLAKEIANHTIYTILAKPVSRQEYIIGKVLGTMTVVLATNALLSMVIYFILAIAQETAPAGLIPCLLLIAMESIVVLSIACFFSVFTNGFLSSCLTFAIFLIGRSNTTLYTIAERGHTSEIRTLAKALYVVLPNLERYNIRDVVAYEKPYPAELLWQGFAYLIAYLVFSTALASFLFQKRDLP